MPRFAARISALRASAARGGQKTKQHLRKVLALSLCRASSSAWPSATDGGADDQPSVAVVSLSSPLPAASALACGDSSLPAVRAALPRARAAGPTTTVAEVAPPAPAVGVSSLPALRAALACPRAAPTTRMATADCALALPAVDDDDDDYPGFVFDPVKGFTQISLPRLDSAGYKVVLRDHTTTTTTTDLATAPAPAAISYVRAAAASPSAVSVTTTSSSVANLAPVAASCARIVVASPGLVGEEKDEILTACAALFAAAESAAAADSPVLALCEPVMFSPPSGAFTFACAALPSSPAASTTTTTTPTSCRSASPASSTPPSSPLVPSSPAAVASPAPFLASGQKEDAVFSFAFPAPVAASDDETEDEDGALHASLTSGSTLVSAPAPVFSAPTAPFVFAARPRLAPAEALFTLPVPTSAAAGSTLFGAYKKHDFSFSCPLVAAPPPAATPSIPVPSEAAGVPASEQGEEDEDEDEDEIVAASAAFAATTTKKVVKPARVVAGRRIAASSRRRRH